MAPIITVDKVSIRFGGLMALSDVSFQMEEGNILAIIGPNGAGKTTLFNCITGFYEPTKGNIFYHRGDHKIRIAQPFEGYFRTLIVGLAGLVLLVISLAAFGISFWSVFPVTAVVITAFLVVKITIKRSMPIHKIANLGVSRTYQNIRLFGQMTGIENLLVAQHNLVNHHLLSGIFKTPGFLASEKKAVERAWYWLEFMDLESAANIEAGNLPYGMQRRLELARTMATSPRLICLDEPAAGLNRQEIEELNLVIVKLRKEHKVSVLLIEHHMGVVMNISDRVVVLDHGEVISEGTPAEVQKDPRVIKAYLGEEEEPQLQSRRGA